MLCVCRMYKGSVPPLIGSGCVFESLEVGSRIKGGSPFLYWNEVYNGSRRLELVVSEDNYVIDYGVEPFMCIEVYSNSLESQKLQINNVGYVWFYIGNVGVNDITVCPCYDGVYTSSNDYVVKGGEYRVMMVPPLNDVLKCPSSVKLE